MTQILERFSQIQQALHKRNQAYTHQSLRFENRLLVSEIGDRIHVDFHASPFEPFFDELLSLLCEPVIASRVQSLHFRCDCDEVGANGTQFWYFATLVDSDATFPNLLGLSIQQYDGVAHNHPIIGYTNMPFDENGTLAKWLNKAPSLQSLSAPSAPNSDFFQRDPMPLERLNIQVGYDAQGFILNFSQSKCFPNLRIFQYRDFDETYMDDFREHCTPFEHFQALFESPAFDSVQSFRWRNPIFEIDEISKLKALRPHVMFKVERVSYDWIK